LTLQLETLKSILLQNDGLGVDNETLERVRHIDTNTRKRNSPYKTPTAAEPLAAVEESCESILDVSDLSFDETRDELAVNNSRHHLRASGGGHNRSKRRSSGGAAAVAAAVKRRKSRSLGAVAAANQEEQVLSATTKVTVDRDGVAHAESIIESVPVPDLKKKARKSRESRGAAVAAAANAGGVGGERRVTYSERNQEFSPTAPPYSEVVTPTHSPLVRRNFSNAGNILHRPHIWQKMTIVKADKCGVCAKRIGFSKTRFVCKECHAVCHLDCREHVPVPCVAASNRTPTNKSFASSLADFAPAEPPMIPAILIHCFREVEERGLSEVGVYRIPGNEADANEILQKFLRGKGTPSLGSYEIHAVASAAKKFLRSLKEPIIPCSLWRTFVDAANSPDATDAEAALYQAVSELPRPNRDTLAFMCLHLQKVAESPDCKMNFDNLGRVWGPTVVGFSSADDKVMLSELPLQLCVVRALLAISCDYWTGFLQGDMLPIEPKPRFPPICTPENAGHAGSDVLRPFALPSALRSAGPVARRTRSRQIERQKYFESPMLS